MNNKRKRNNKPISLTTLKKSILDIFINSVDSLGPKQINKILNIKDKIRKHQVLFILKNLMVEGLIREVSHGLYISQKTVPFYKGKIDKIPSGAGYIICDSLDTDVYVSSRNAQKTFGGDNVKFILTGAFKGKNPEGRILSVIERGRKEYVGNIRMDSKSSFMSPDNSKVGTDFYISKNELNGAKNGDKVIVELIEWPKKAKSPFGKVIKIIGKSGNHHTEIHAILSEYGLPYEFPKAVEDYVASIPENISSKEISKRRDMRNICTFTIDPKDAKDFDDALSIEKIENDVWEIGIHIADVSHYLKEESLLNDEAYQRATSVYLVDRVVPMLPEKLSNKVCSLRPNEEKLCFSAVITMNSNAEILKEWFGRTVIYSDHRFTYEDAQSVIDQKKGVFSQEILFMNMLARKMRKRRINAGAITFDRVEVKFHLDKNYHPTGVHFKKSKDANKLIEEFMLLANKRVAAFIGKAKNGKATSKAFVYRVHDFPDTEKINTFSTFVKQFGYTLDINNPREIAHSMNRILSDVDGKLEENIVELLAIRTMSKAKYTINNIGHYGLGFDYYTHFTSPIRRWPDIMVHRLLQKYLEGEVNPDKIKLEEQCKHSSSMEKLSTEAERASIKYMQVKYLMGKEGELFDGQISGVTDFGIFVELKDSLCEGRISLRNLKDDHYELNKETFSLIGRNTGNKFQLGDSLRIRILNVDLIKKQIDFGLV